ncbi:hypothetical protein CC86DRAFT_409437 [Ophiobolus disseminans]|uniref:BTB domain-containing protein n=1 Tax=Ophiobolus disseminans TaxID=1469910 RepID=A0A6A6ZR02_9PLEO|nr:hypothetical protein CC86DRAFT_409437 [Ophiobolus disseminans]
MTDTPANSTFADLIQSDLFTFHIGAEKKAFVAHSHAIAATSEPFRALVNGGLAESTTRCAELDDVEPEDFVRFLEYAYRRNYTVPAWRPGESVHASGDGVKGVPPAPPDEPALAPEYEPGPELEAVHPEVHAVAEWPSRLNKKFSKRGRKGLNDVTLRARFQNCLYSTDEAPDLALQEGYEPRTNLDMDQDFTPVFLAHARLYTFADMRLVYPLKALALDKLYKTLVAFQLYTERMGDVVKLARYAYENGPDRSEAGEPNELRKLVVEYIACEVDTVGKNREFRALIEEGGKFVGDFWTIVSRYVL